MQRSLKCHNDISFSSHSNFPKPIPVHCGNDERDRVESGSMRGDGMGCEVRRQTESRSVWRRRTELSSHQVNENGAKAATISADRLYYVIKRGQMGVIGAAIVLPPPAWFEQICRLQSEMPSHDEATTELRHGSLSASICRISRC
jgi:hypothetical protein